MSIFVWKGSWLVDLLPPSLHALTGAPAPLGAGPLRPVVVVAGQARRHVVHGAVQPQHAVLAILVELPILPLGLHAGRDRGLRLAVGDIPHNEETLRQNHNSPFFHPTFAAISNFAARSFLNRSHLALPGQLSQSRSTALFTAAQNATARSTPANLASSTRKKPFLTIFTKPRFGPPAGEKITIKLHFCQC